MKKIIMNNCKNKRGKTVMALYTASLSSPLATCGKIALAII
jgi:hypothetical protein